MWKDLMDVPLDKYVLLKAEANEREFVVIGEAIVHRGRRHYLWRGDYSEVVDAHTGGENPEFIGWADL